MALPTHTGSCIMKSARRLLLSNANMSDTDAAAIVATAIRRLGTLREHRWVRAWAYRIATREAVRAARRARRALTDAIDDWADLPAPAADEPAVDPALVAELPRRLDALPPAAQAVLRLRYLHDLTQPEIAEVLEIPLGTVKSRLAYGIEALRRTWTAERGVR